MRSIDILEGTRRFFYDPNRSLFLCLTLLANFIFLAGLKPTYSADPMVLVAAEGTVDTVISEVIVKRAYAKLGIKLHIEKHPGERALLLANSGRVAGDVQRINGLSSKYQNMIQIFPAINFIEGSAFSTRADIKINGWQSLSEYRVGLIRGIKFAENNTQGMHTYVARDYENMFFMLTKDRIDIAISPRLNGLYQTKKLGIENVTALTPAIARFDLYHYLHKDHAELVPKLSAIFQEMADTGELERTRAHVIKVLMEHAENKLPICDVDYACFD